MKALERRILATAQACRDWKARPEVWTQSKVIGVTCPLIVGESCPIKPKPGESIELVAKEVVVCGSTTVSNMRSGEEQLTGAEREAWLEAWLGDMMKKESKEFAAQLFPGQQEARYTPCPHTKLTPKNTHDGVVCKGCGADMHFDSRLNRWRAVV